LAYEAEEIMIELTFDATRRRLIATLAAGEEPDGASTNLVHGEASLGIGLGTEVRLFMALGVDITTLGRSPAG